MNYNVVAGDLINDTPANGYTGTTVNGYLPSQLGSGLAATNSNSINMLSNPEFNQYLGTQGVNDTNDLTYKQLQDYGKQWASNGNTFKSPITPNFTDGLYNKLGGLFGTNGQTIKDIGGFAQGMLGFGNTLYNMYNTNKQIGLAEKYFNDQMAIEHEKLDQARKDRATADANRKTATAQYYRTA